MTDGEIRRSWLVSAASLALWAVSALSLVGYMLAIGSASVQRQVPNGLSRSALESGVEPLVVLLGATVALGALAVVSLLYYSYAQWRHVVRRRRRLESEPTSDSDRDIDRA